MGTELRATFLLVFSVISFGFSAPQVQKGQPRHEKISIPKVDPFEHPVTLPPDVLKVLLNADEVKSSLGSATDCSRNHPAELFFASEARLGPPDEVDFIVLGLGPFHGASFDWYWIVRPTPKKPKVVLFATGNVIEVMDSRTHGYRDIRTVGGTHWEIDEAVYHFDGKKYKPWKRKWVENRP